MKITLVSILFFFALLFGTNSKADVYGGTNGIKVITTIEGGYVALGLDSNNFYVVKVAQNGILIWNKTLILPNSELISLVQTPDSGFVLAGRINNSATLTKLNSAGDSLWTYSYIIDFDNTGYGRTININSNGDFVFGISTDPKGPDNPSFMLIIDPLGNILDSVQIALGSDWQGWPESKKDVNGSYINALNGQIYSDYILSLIDSAGNVLWSIHRTDTSYNYYAISPCVADTGFFVAGRWNNTSPQLLFSILKVDPLGNILWERLTNMNISLDKIVSFKDGFAGLGGERLYRFNTMGDTLWSKAVPGAKNFDTIPQGGFVFTGDSIGQLWISVTDTSGTQLRFGTVGINESSFFKSTISIYPNPNNGILSIDFHYRPVSDLNIEICDESGRVMRKIRKSDYTFQNTICTIDLRDFLSKSGNYVIRISEKGKPSHSEKILFLGK